MSNRIKCIYCEKTATRWCPGAPRFIIDSRDIGIVTAGRPPRLSPEVKLCSECCGKNRLLYTDCPVTCQYLSAGPKYWLKKYKITDEEHELINQYLDVLCIVGSVVVYMKRSQIHKDGLINDNIREGLANLFMTFEKAMSGIIYQDKSVNFRVVEFVATLGREFAKFKDYKLTPKEQSPTKHIYNGLKFLLRIYPRYNVKDSFIYFLSLFKYYKPYDSMADLYFQTGKRHK